MARSEGSRSTRRPTNQVRTKLWQSMRILRRFTSADLAMTAEAGRSNTQHYMRALANAGYLLLVRPRVSGSPGSRHLWQLVRDAGPQMPIVWTDGRVFDPNTGKTWCSEGLEVASSPVAPTAPAVSAAPGVEAIHE